MKKLMFCVVLVFFAGALPAQKVIHRVNDKFAPAKLTGATAWFAIEAQAPATKPLVIIGVEFVAEPRTGAQAFAIYDKDPATGKPGKQLALGTFTAIPCQVWQGGVFNTPLFIKPGQKFFVGYQNRGGILPITVKGTGAVNQIHYFGTSWSGPHPTQPWTYRLYTPGGIGKYVPYGTGKSGTAGTADLKGLGWPNIGNPIGQLARNVPLGGQGFLALGRHHPGLPLGPFGKLYTFPVFAVFPLTTLSGKRCGAFYVELPGDPALSGALLAWQAWFLDQGAAAGIVHTQGVDMTIGG